MTPSRPVPEVPPLAPPGSRWRLYLLLAVVVATAVLVIAALLLTAPAGLPPVP